ncbi:hypothetical protein DSO57_1022953 [Entomophthora muscae]|uniref:Uncharacterized protein n=1 Tax=Entomophthora muscae TaxID=34485 RepID=A0ACC2S577_9FUNG|nr:hypothetical protein DSO57_1022953 [Entomophthora muscae]
MAFQAWPASPVGVQPDSGMGHDRPHICIMDFDPAQFNAFEQLFNAEVQGCHFHFCQVVAQNVQAHAKLSKFSQRDTLDTCKFVLTQFSALAFLKPDHTAQGFKVLSKDPYTVNHLYFKSFLEYFEPQ